MKTHTHAAKDDGTIVTHAHSSHDAEEGHSHHADGPDGATGPMLTVEDDDDTTPGDGDQVEDVDDDDLENPLDDVRSNGAPTRRRHGLVRARAGVSWRAAEGDDAGTQGTLFGYFSTFNQWYEIDSWWEGRFMECVLPGAFADTIANDRSSMRVLYDHGMDFNMGNKPLGAIQVLREDEKGAYYEVGLYDTDYNRGWLVPVLRGQMLSGEESGDSGLGASFRFEVLEDQWNLKPKVSKRNPDGLPERKIVRSRVYEFGPVTFPANGGEAGASAGVRSLSDLFQSRLAHDTRFLSEFTERVGPKVAARMVAEAQGVPELPVPARQQPASRSANVDQLRRRARALLVVGR